MAQPVDVMAVLAARDRRAARQKELLRIYGRPLICFTMNIAGPVKRSARIDRGFAIGLERLEQQLLRLGGGVLHRETIREDTGCEAIYVVELPARQLKEMTVELEEADALGRLFDMDVLAEDGVKLERCRERGCLICGRSGKGCARSRAHSVVELQQRTAEILDGAAAQHDRELVGELACRALLYEVCTTPKPGLVDRRNNGSHRDMDLFTFMASSAALQPYFSRCAAIGRETACECPEATLAALRQPGKEAEGKMLRATGGVNTHKGAIFALGLVCGALGRLERRLWADAEQVLAECGRMAAGLTARELEGAEDASTAGRQFYLQQHIRGIRGEAEDGFPSVRRAGLPVLEQALEQGKTLEEAGGAALLALMAAAEDTALMHRAGVDGWAWVQQHAAQILAAGVTRQALEQLDREMIGKNYSPGGSADLLAICYLLHFLGERPVE